MRLDNTSQNQPALFVKKDIDYTLHVSVEVEIIYLLHFTFMHFKMHKADAFIQSD